MKRWSFAIVLVLVGFAAGWYFVGSTSQGQPARKAAATSFAHDAASYRDVVKAVLPAVVSIETKYKAVKVSGTKKGQKNSVPFDDSQLPEEFRKFFGQFGGSLPELPDMPRGGFGSGFFIDPSGVILTNNHVVDSADTVLVQLHDGRKFTAHNIRTDPRTDLAIITLDSKGPFPYLELGDSDAMEVGDRVLAFGAPFGLTGSVTQGIVSAKGRNGMKSNMYEDFIQTDATINPGNSGGPLVSLDGKVVGIDSMIKSDTGAFQGVGFAVASNLAKHVADSLRKDGIVHRGYLGVKARDLDPDVAKRLKLPEDQGVLIADVLEGTPAAKAGLKDGEILLMIGDHPVKSSRSLQSMVAELPIGKATKFTVVNDDGSRHQVAVTIEEQPKEFGVASAPSAPATPNRPESVALEKVGIEVADLNDDTASTLGLQKGMKGAVITDVQSGSVADEAGLRRGMVITRVDSNRVNDAATLRRTLDAASLSHGVLLQVTSGSGGTNLILLKDGNS